MRYRVEDGHGLPRNPFKAIVAPRPIGWISSVDGQGRANLAPYSFFNGVADDPPCVMFSTTGTKVGREDEIKDSLSNIRETGEFAVNIATWDLREAMNATSGGYAHETDEFDLAGLAKAACLMIAPPRVRDAAATLECVRIGEVVLPEGAGGGQSVVTLGRVVAVHIDDACITPEGRYDATARGALARCGYKDYAVVREVFEMTRPGGGDAEAMSARG